MDEIVVLGLGSGDERQLTLGVWQEIRQAGEIRVRTGDHPAVRYIRDEGIRVISYDSVYEEKETFAEVYEEIVSDLLEQARRQDGPVYYAVPGHPGVAEATVALLRERCGKDGIELRILGGESFLDQAFLRLGIDPVDGFMVLDASQMKASQLNPEMHILIAQVYDVFTASDAKLTLMELYPHDYEVVLAQYLGVPGKERIVRMPLEEVDRQPFYGNHAMIWVPAARDDRLRVRTFERLREIVEILRGPEGCPWDREQTHESIRKNLIEETCEVLERIDEYDPDGLCEELGDLLMQVMLHAQMEAERGTFDIRDVVQRLNEKLVRRHPHVFGDKKAQSAGEALQNWEQIKRGEKERQGERMEERSLLDGIPPALTAMLTAWKYQKRAAKVGFDWERAEDVVAKLEEEIRELREAIAAGSAGSDSVLQDELGDVLFSAVNVARLLDIDPEQALARANRKFYERFAYIEGRLKAQGKSFSETNLQEMEYFWQEAKKKS